MKFISPIVTQGSGSLSGSTWSRNKGGAYVRNRSHPTQPRTPAQVQVRASTAFSANAYANTLTPAQRSGWNDFALQNPQPNKVGGTMILSALAMFNKANVPVLNALGNSNIVLDSPGAVTLLPILAAGPTIDVTAGTIVIDVISPEDFAIGDILTFFITKPCSPGKTPVHQPYSQIAGVKLAAVPTTADNYTHTFTDPDAGSRVVGQPYQIKAQWFRGGNFSPVLRTQGIVD